MVSLGAMTDYMIRGEDYEKKAEKKLDRCRCTGTGYKYKQVADSYEKAANCFKLGGRWHRAGAAYIKCANCYLKFEGKQEAALAYVDAANCYMKISVQDGAQYLNLAVKLFSEIGKFDMEARYCKELGELCEREHNLRNATCYFERAADLFQREGVTTSANLCKQKVAEFAALLEEYPKAIEIFEAIARHSMNNNFNRYTVKGILLNAGICQLCGANVVAITNKLEQYQELDPTFSGTREYRLLAGLAASIDEVDVRRFNDVIKKHDSLIRLDPWKTTLLRKAEQALKAKEEEENDLT